MAAYTVLRRWDLNRPEQWKSSNDQVVVNEGLLGSVSLGSSAFVFRTSLERPENRELSVYNESALNSLGYDASTILLGQMPSLRIARGSSAHVIAVRIDQSSKPLEIVEDPFPFGKEGSHPREEAHELILCDGSLSNRLRNAYSTALAMIFSARDVTQVQ